MTEAIRRLRQAIQSLNREGRERLLGAFDAVNAHFQELFTRSSAAARRIWSWSNPTIRSRRGLKSSPSRRARSLQVLSLLSGGEQALTAHVADLRGVPDQPGADLRAGRGRRAARRRQCRTLLRPAGADASKRTETRFLIITHNPITMARMDRLFGVTMAERGVSQLVSVELAEVERFLEAV